MAISLNIRQQPITIAGGGVARAWKLEEGLNHVIADLSFSTNGDYGANGLVLRPTPLNGIGLSNVHGAILLYDRLTSSGAIVFGTGTTGLIAMWDAVNGTLRFMRTANGAEAAAGTDILTTHTYGVLFIGIGS